MGTAEYVIGGLWFLSAAALAIGWGMLGPSPEDFTIAKSFFVAAGVAFGMSGIVWGINSDAPWLIRIAIVGFIAAVAAISVTEGIRLASRRQGSADRAAPSVVPASHPQSPTVRDIPKDPDGKISTKKLHHRSIAHSAPLGPNTIGDISGNTGVITQGQSGDNHQ